MTKYDTDLINNLVNGPSTSNESLFSAYDYLVDNNENNNSSYSGGGSQHLATILHQLFSKMLDNQTKFISQSNFPLSNSSSSSLFPTSLFSYETFLPTSKSNKNSYHLFTSISLWFVLIINPIVILFGVTGNVLATYILIHCNIAKLPVSFYTIMLNISDTLNLLIPVFIFWLDNCINRIPERGYFRDRSNFLCKALLCPDQLFAALSAWYMCAISFNRWYSVCRPSSYFFRTSGTVNASITLNNNTSDIHRGLKKHSSASTTQSTSSFLSIGFPWNCCNCLIRNMKLRQHLQAFRSIAFITLVGMLCCLYPIFMHELRPITLRNEHIFDLKHKITHTYPIVWQRCYYSQKHEYAYDIIGIILSCFLHILPLTFVAAMNIMIIVRLKQRQRLMTVSKSVLSSQISNNNQKKSDGSPPTRFSYGFESSISEQRNRISFPSPLTTTRKDQATSTDLSIQTPRPSAQQLNIPTHTSIEKRHHSRDRAITIMLVSVALSYLILTLPYRLFWSYNVYIKRMYPEKLNSSIYLLKMHYIDHVLRTIRNIHYGTNFVFFIFLSKTFRRKFQQIFIEKFLQIIHRNTSNINTNNGVIISRNNRQRRLNLKVNKRRNIKTKNGNHLIEIDYLSRSIFDETPSIIADVRMQEDEIVPIIELEHNNLSRYDGE